MENNNNNNNNDSSNNNIELQNEIEQTNSMTMNLENLQQQYSNLLISYQQATANYVNYLNQQAQLPCGDYTSGSTGIDQNCYNYIWQQGGCGSGNTQPNASTSWAQGQTLNSLINNTFLWATGTDYNSRMGCYGTPGNPYIIIGVGTTGTIFSRQGLDAPWVQINDNSAGCTAVCTMNNGQGLLGIQSNNIYQKSSYDANWSGPINNACCVTGVAMGQDGTVVGVGLNNVLWSKMTLNGGWTETSSPGGEWVSAVAIAPNGSIFVVGENNQIYTKNSYQNLPSQTWQAVGSNTCCVKAITIAPDGTLIGVGTDDQLYTMSDYTNLTGSWQGPYSSENTSCCVIGITTVANPNYNASNYSQLSQPNYNINNEPYVSMTGYAFNGTGSAGQSSATNLQDCIASCSNTSNCTGATFVSNQCLLRTGNSPIVPSSIDSYAIVPESVKLLFIIENINQELINVNQQISNQMTSANTLYDSQTEQRFQQQQNLIKSYTELMEERKDIQNLLKEYETLDNTTSNDVITINQRFYTYIFLFILVVVIVFILSKLSYPSTSKMTVPTVQYGGDLGMSAYFILFVIIFITVCIKYLTQ
jgi:hypothetical protein